MGLDQYLFKKHYVRNWDHMKPEELHHITITKDCKPADIKPERIYEISELVIQWRKSNQIHLWFVEHVQNGEDDCKDYYVDREQLKELLGELKMALGARHLAGAILPTKDGFFFGSQEYDEYYWQDLKFTEEELTKVLAEAPGGDFYYSSSW